MTHVLRRHILCVVFAFQAILIFGVTTVVDAASIWVYSDKISDSAPGYTANHTITFTTTRALSPGGIIQFTPEPGVFTIPTSNFDNDNVLFQVDTGLGFITRTLASTTSATEDGLAITRGLNGNILIELNSTTGIPASSTIRLLVGTHTPGATSTDVTITNPGAVGTYAYYLSTNDGLSTSTVKGYYAIIDKVTVGPIDTTETIPPFRFGGAPTGTISGTSLSVELTLRTDEFARCRYATASGTPYFSMGAEFSQTNFSVIHTKVIAVTPDASSSVFYDFYVRCIDDEGNFNITDYAISFELLPIPIGTPGPDGDDEGQGDGTGAGAGDSDPGAGDPDGSDDTSGGSSGGGGGGGGGGGTGASTGGDDGSGGFEGTDKPYQSGDGEVTITGNAFPRSTIVVLVDGKKADETRSTNSGNFEITLENIARGAYSFGVYGVDSNGVKSSTFTTTFTVTGARATKLSNINVMPSILVEPDPVDPDSTAVFSGYTLPNAEVTIENQKDKSSVTLKEFTATSDSDGFWTLDVSTDGFTVGTYKVRARAEQTEGLGISTNFSDYTFYGVGEEATILGSSDLNRDGFVNLTDFSILLFWWNTDGGESNPPADINQDGRVSLTDFSIMIFNWTG